MQDGPNPEPEIVVGDIDTAPATTPATQGDTAVTTEDFRTAFVRVSEEKALIEQELEATKKRVRTIEILDELIEPYAKRSFIFMCAYCATVGIMLIFHGFKVGKFSLPDGVLQFLVGSTAATVIGLVGMVLTGIFIGARRRDP